MRILVVTWGFPRADQRFLVDKVDAIARHGHEVRVLCAPGHTDPGLAPHPAVRVRPVLRERPRSVVAQAQLLAQATVRDAQFVERVVTQTHAEHASFHDRVNVLERVLPFAGERPDLVHFEFANWAASYQVALPFLDCPAVVECQGSDLLVEPIEHASLRRRLVTLFARVARVVCVSNDLGRAAIELGTDPTRLAVIPEGIDTGFFTPDGAQAPGDEQIRLVSVGRLHWVKGYEYALHAVGILRARGHPVTYTIAGHDEGAGRSLQRAARDLGLESVVRMPGALSQVGVRNLLSASDVFVLSSVSEGLCKAALEAMAMGLPVVTTNVGGMSEAVLHGRTGLVVGPRDPVALADAIESLITDPGRRRRLGAAGADRARRCYDSADQIRQLLAVFAEVVQHDRVARARARATSG